MSDISVAVLEDMRLHIAPQEVARDNEHNSATFRIVSQPSSLDALACRAEIQTDEGTTYRLVEDGAFALTNDIAVRGLGRLQLVYSDGLDVMRKTSIATFHVSPSLNAVDPSAPGFGDGLAQMQLRAFATAQGSNDGITFYNISGQAVGLVTYPPAGGGDLTEARADTLYLRQDGTTRMQGNVQIEGSGRGVIFDPLGLGAVIYTDSLGFRFRRGVGNSEITIENSDGAAISRSPIVTLATGDGRYLTPAGAETTYLRKAGDQMSGPLITANGTSVTNPGLGIGDNSTGFYRAGNSLGLAVGGQLYAQWLATPSEMMSVVRLNMATQPIQNLADPREGAPGVMDAANRRYVDTAVAAIPRPNGRTYLTNTLDLTPTTQVLLDQPYPVANNNIRTVVITVFPSFSGGTASQFYDLIYTCSVAPLIEARTTVYPTAGAYMLSPVRFAATVTPVNNQIQVQVVVRLNAAGTGTLTIVGSGTDRRSYVTIEEMVN